MKTKPTYYLILLTFLFISGITNAKSNCFLLAKTFFQTDRFFKPKIYIDVDSVVVHRHIHDPKTLIPSIKSWQDNYSCVGKMFFANSDGGNIFWSGKWNGVNYENDIEVDSATNKLTGSRPYIVPTKEWIAYLKEMTLTSLYAGVKVIMPEEPLAHAYTGYSPAFKKMWEKYYGFPWMAENSSPIGRYLTGELKAKQFLHLENELADVVLKFNKKNNKNTAFVVPIHSLYGNIAASLSVPLGISTSMKNIDGYVGQIWTGPVKWSLDSYFSDDKSFFCSAFALYNYFTQLTIGTDKKLWLLVDPVDDDPHHTWQDFSKWYEHCVAAMLMMSDVNSYEVMPWPDRIFLSGYEMGGGSPAPENFRIKVLSITEALQEMPKGGKWITKNSSIPIENIAVAVADSAMYERQEYPGLQGMYGLLMPLVARGIPVSSFVMERVQERNYADLYKVIILSFENFKPTTPKMNTALANWVKRGGSLLFFGDVDDELDKADYFWWHKLGFDSPAEHLFSELHKPRRAKEYWKYGKGRIYVSRTSPREFANSEMAEKVYLNYLNWVVKKSKISKSLNTPGYLCIKRGDFIIAHAEKKNFSLKGKFVNIFNPQLIITDDINLKKGESGLFKNVINDFEINQPAVLFSTHRLIYQKYKDNKLMFKIKGPAETPGVARIFFPSAKNINVKAKNSNGENVKVSIKKNKETFLIKFPNYPDGVIIVITGAASF